MLFTALPVTDMGIYLATIFTSLVSLSMINAAIVGRRIYLVGQRDAVCAANQLVIGQVVVGQPVSDQHNHVRATLGQPVSAQGKE